MSLATLPDLEIAPGLERDVELSAGERLLFAIGLDDHGPAVLPDAEGSRRHLETTDRWWRSWSSNLDLPSVGEAAVLRSLLTLRLLTYAPSGAPAAAPTTSLPEIPGGPNNWDYRHAWIRDASMGVSSFLVAGSVAEPRAFLWWMLHASRLTRPELRVVYDLTGGTNLAERELLDLPGYRGARPVRVGNAAAQQFQLDAYGWILDAGSAYLAATGDLYRETWRSFQGHADLLAERWPEPDHGIWELRGERRQYVHSKAMAWLGLDRAIAIARRLGSPRRRVERWTSARARLAEEIASRGFDDRSGAYTQAFGSTELDASALALAYMGLEPSDSPRIRGTIDAVRRNLGAGGPLVYRFRPEGEGAFLPCSFWLSRALAATDRLDDARALFEQTCSLATPLGLFAEEMEPSSGEHLGNFPLAFTHAALVLAADELVRAERRLKDGGTDRGSPRTRREPRSPRSASPDRS
jgi:GH15 family glucan-1,4-alpha-glucosidase